MNKKEQILHAALEVFARQGLEKGKIADIAKEAGIGKGTIYEYYKSKEEIFHAIEDMFISDTILQLQTIVQSDKKPTIKIEEICQISLDLHHHLGDSILIIAELWAQHSRGVVHGHDSTIFADMYKDYYKIIEDVLKEGIAKKEFREMSINGVATLLLAMIDGVIWQSVIFKNDKIFESNKKEAIKAFMNGIKK